jgi:hypothetical protein
LKSSSSKSGKIEKANIVTANIFGNDTLSKVIFVEYATVHTTNARVKYLSSAGLCLMIYPFKD